MPHITKTLEKWRCVKPNILTPLEQGYLYTFPTPDEVKPIKIIMGASKEQRKSFIQRQQKQYYDRHSLFELIEEVIDSTLPKVINENFEQFVDIKEVPYGRYNSDSDYLGS